MSWTAWTNPWPAFTSTLTPPSLPSEVARWLWLAAALLAPLVLYTAFWSSEDKLWTWKTAYVDRWHRSRRTEAALAGVVAAGLYGYASAADSRPAAFVAVSVACVATVHLSTVAVQRQLFKAVYVTSNGSVPRAWTAVRRVSCGFYLFLWKAFYVIALAALLRDRALASGAAYRAPVYWVLVGAYATIPVAGVLRVCKGFANEHARERRHGRHGRDASLALSSESEADDFNFSEWLEARAKDAPAPRATLLEMLAPFDDGLYWYPAYLLAERAMVTATVTVLPDKPWAQVVVVGIIEVVGLTMTALFRPYTEPGEDQVDAMWRVGSVAMIALAAAIHQNLLGHGRAYVYDILLVAILLCTLMYFFYTLGPVRIARGLWQLKNVVKFQSKVGAYGEEDIRKMTPEALEAWSAIQLCIGWSGFQHVMLLRHHGHNPSVMSKLQFVDRIDATGASLKGAIPEALGHLGALAALDLRDNDDLFGVMPLSVLRLHLDGCRVEVDGEPRFTLPADLGDLGGAVEKLDLASWPLIGRIPESIAACGNLRRLDIRGCPGLNGELPVGLLRRIAKGCLVRVEDGGSFALPSTLGSLGGALKEVHLSSHAGWQLSGQIPSTLGGLVSLTKLNLYGHSRLRGNIPESLCALTKLRELVLTGCSGLTGPIPAGLGALTRLEYISLWGCKSLTGAIPDSIGALTKLQYLSLCQCGRLTGRVPKSVSRLTRLKKFVLHECQSLTIQEGWLRMKLPNSEILLDRFSTSNRTLVTGAGQASFKGGGVHPDAKWAGNIVSPEKRKAAFRRDRRMSTGSTLGVNSVTSIGSMGQPGQSFASFGSAHNGGSPVGGTATDALTTAGAYLSPTNNLAGLIDPRASPTNLPGGLAVTILSPTKSPQGHHQSFGGNNSSFGGSFGSSFGESKGTFASVDGQLVYTATSSEAPPAQVPSAEARRAGFRKKKRRRHSTTTLDEDNILDDDATTELSGTESDASPHKACVIEAVPSGESGFHGTESSFGGSFGGSASSFGGSYSASVNQGSRRKSSFGGSSRNATLALLMANEAQLSAGRLPGSPADGVAAAMRGGGQKAAAM